MEPARPLRGRDAELDLGRSVLTAPAGALVIGGAAGVGKSRLANELAETVADELGLDIVRIVGSRSLATVPAGALAPLLAAAESPPAEPSATTLLPTVHRLLADRSRDRSLLLFIEQAHHLDPLSAMVVHSLAGQRSMRVLVTLRSGAPVPDDVVALWKEDNAQRLDLLVLSEAEIGEVAADLLGAPLAHESVVRLAKRSGGNPLAVRELILDSVEHHRFEHAHGVARWLDQSDVGPRVVDLVGSWIGSIDAATAEALLLVALGEPLPVDRLTGGELNALGRWRSGAPSRSTTGGHGSAIRCTATPPGPKPRWRPSSG